MEVLLGLLIFAIIAATIYSVLSGGIKLSRVSEGRVAVYREASWAVSLFARELENMARYDVTGMEDVEPLFQGEKDEITFLLPTNDGLKYIRYSLLAPTSGKIHQVVLGQRTDKNVDIQLTDTVAERSYFLVREEYEIHEALTGDASGAIPEIIAGNIKADSLRFEYAYADNESGDKIRYEEEWGQNEIPSKIRMTLKLIDEYNHDTVSLTRDVLIPHGVLGQSEI